MSDGSNLFNAIIGFIHGKTPASALSADAEKLLVDARKIIAGANAALPDAPSLLADVAKLAAEATALAASKGLDLPALGEAGLTLQKLAADYIAAQTAFLAGMANYQTAALVVASAPKVATP